MKAPKQIYINGIDTGYSIYENGMIRYRDHCIDDPYIKMGDKVFKMDPNYLVALFYLDNPREHQSVRNWGMVEWYTDKNLIKQAIDIEKKYYDDKIEMIGTDRERVIKACELMSNPEIRLPYVSSITGIPSNELRAIRLGNKWNDIGRNYIFPINNDTNDSRYTDKQIFDVCDMLSNIKTFKVSLIQRMTNVNINTIHSILLRKSYQNISMYYEFNHTIDHNPDVYTVQQIHHACFMLEHPSYTYNDISQFCNMSLDVLYKIRDRKLFYNISSEFDTESERIYDDNPWTFRIIQLLQDGVPKWEIISRIQLEYNIANRNEVQAMINEIKEKYLNVSGSTTILDEE